MVCGSQNYCWLVWGSNTYFMKKYNKFIKFIWCCYSGFFCDILSLNVKMYLRLKLYTVPFFLSGQTYKIRKGSNNYCSQCTQVFTAFAQYFVDAPLAAITASSLFEYDATSLAHLSLGSFAHSSLQHLSSSIRLDGKRQCTAIFRSLQRCSIGFKSGLWLGHSRTFTELSWSHSFDILAVCLGSLSCWKMNRHPSLRSRALWSRFSSRMSLYIAAFIFPSILTSLPVPATEKHPHSMMLPPPCFTVGMVLAWWWAVPGFLQT